jgi:FdhE protein
MPAPDPRERAREFGMPPLDRSRFKADAAFDLTLDRLLSLTRDIDMPKPAHAALLRTIGADPLYPTSSSCTSLRGIRTSSAV